MDVREILDELSRCAALPVEQQFVNSCAAALADENVSEHLRFFHVDGLMRSEAAHLVAAPWGCSINPDVWRALAELGGGIPSPADLLRRALAGGLGLAATNLGIGRTVWAPAFAVREVERRCGLQLDVADSRWAVPYWWPVPIEQLRIDGLVDDGFAATVLQQLGFACTEPVLVDGPAYPDDWLTADDDPGPTRDDLLACMLADPPSAVRALLSSYGGDPLAGAAQCLGVQAMHAAAMAANTGQPWNGGLFGGCSLATYGETCVLASGWWRSALLGLDCTCHGAGPAETVPIERWLITRGGGTQADIGQPLPVFILPVHLGQPIRALPLDWSQVPNLG